MVNAPPLKKVRKTGIVPQDTLAEAARKIMRYHFQAMKAHEAGSYAGDDVEAIHDMRVATRRMRSAFEVFGHTFDPEVIRKHQKGLKQTADALGLVRDFDVFIEKAEAFLEKQKKSGRIDLAALLEYWRARQRKAHRKLVKHLDSNRYHKFTGRFQHFIDTPGKGALPISPKEPVPHTVSQLAPSLIYDQIAQVRAYAPVLPGAPIETMHELRIEFKKLRYIIEFLQDVLGPETAAVITVLKKVQDHLGDLNDANIACNQLNRLIEYQVKDTRNWYSRKLSQVLSYVKVEELGLLAF